MTERLIYDPSEEDAPLVARGDSRLDEDASAIASPLPGVEDECWTEFVRRMVTAALSAVSAANALGRFEMTPRRLADLGIVERLGRRRAEGRTIWVAVFLPPLTCEKFLRSPGAQYDAFSRSMTDYAKRLDSGEIANEPCVSLSGALAILHRCGPQGLDTWTSGERFAATRALHTKVEGLF
jgi:hypothetical protein